MHSPHCSATFSHPLKFKELLGGVTKNSSGHVVGARTTLTQVVMQVTRSRIDISDVTNQAGLGEEVTGYWISTFVLPACVIP